MRYFKVIEVNFHSRFVFVAEVNIHIAGFGYQNIFKEKVGVSYTLTTEYYLSLFFVCTKKSNQMNASQFTRTPSYSPNIARVNIKCVFTYLLVTFLCVPKEK